ncbi:MAG: hypothetical protein AB7P02_25190 [Alphaproteobacteria bacterium]
MSLWRDRIVPALRRRLLRVATGRAPDKVIGGAERPYLRRWHLVPRNPLLNVYLHHFLRSDDDRALHDHPWPSCSIILAGGYDEVLATRGGTTAAGTRLAGDVVVRGARTAHRVALFAPAGPAGRIELPCWTLFLTGPRLRAWGFWCPIIGWVHWRDFTAGPNGEVVGKGCDQ